jgi:branched-subunit amino acid ABC-type transport system permease component
MIDTLVYGLTIGAILYLFSIGLSITFGTMKIINFGHAITYTLGVYFFITFLSIFNGIYIIAALLSIVCIIPVAFVIEKFIIRKLYGS